MDRLASRLAHLQQRVVVGRQRQSEFFEQRLVVEVELHAGGEQGYGCESAVGGGGLLQSALAHPIDPSGGVVVDRESELCIIVERRPDLHAVKVGSLAGEDRIVEVREIGRVVLVTGELDVDVGVLLLERLDDLTPLVLRGQPGTEGKGDGASGIGIAARAAAAGQRERPRGG